MEPISRKQTQDHSRQLFGRSHPGLRAEVTRHGTPIWVYRAPGVYHQMKSAPGSVAFWHEYTDASRGLRVADATTAPLLKDPSSVRWLVNEYIGSTDFADNFKPSTQKGIRNILKRFAEKNDGVAYASVKAKHIKDLRDHVAQFGADPANPKPAKAMANRVVSAIRGMYDWAIEEKELLSEDANPCATVKRKKHTSKARHKWTEVECDAFEKAYDIGTRERLMYELLLTGQRCCDIVRMGPQHIERHGDVELMQIVQQKTGKPAKAAIPPLLAEAIAKTPLGKATFIGSEHDSSPISAGHFGNVMRRACDAIGVPECTAHGVRHYVATHLLQQGCDVSELMAVLGDTMERCQGYVREFEGTQAALRAAHKMGRNRKPDLKVVKAA
jgi:site-specific recombinase XerD